MRQPAQSFRQALDLAQTGNVAKAKKICQAILVTTPSHADALNLLGLIAREENRFEEAIGYFSRAIAAVPRSPLLYFNLGDTHLLRQDLNNAITAYRNCLALDPNHHLALHNLGKAYQDQGQVKTAIDYYRRSLKIKKDFPEACYNMAIAYEKMGDLVAAEERYRQAIRLKPDFVFALNNLALVLQARGKVDEAVVLYQQALAISPNFLEACNNLGTALQTVGRIEEAIACYRTFLASNPDCPEALENIVDQLQYACDWRQLEPYLQRLDQLTDINLQDGEKPATSPFLSLRLTNDPARHYAIARAQARHLAKSSTGHISPRQWSQEEIRQRSTRKRLTIGYLSHDFRSHAIGHIFAGILPGHDRERFSILCYSSGKNDNSSHRRRIEDASDRFLDISTLSLAEAAQRIYEDGVDILVEMNGYTAGSRLEVCAYRPAPLQVAYLGYLGTTGTDFIDYILADRLVAPPDQAPHYSEQFVYLPHCYQVTDFRTETTAKKWSRSECGLPEEAVVFCSFNQPYKYEPEMFDVWMRIMHQSPKSVLWMRKTSDLMARNLRMEAEIRGIAGDRLLFAPNLPLNDHLARLTLADIALDTRIYNGGATTNNALWANVPVVTLLGSSFVSRMSTSSLATIGTPELIARSLQEYEAVALSLANNPIARQELREKIAAGKKQSPLFDMPRFVRNLEKAYLQMWAQLRNGFPPQQLLVQECDPASPERS